MNGEGPAAPSTTDLFEIVWWSCRAPTVQDARPWHWSVDAALELLGDVGAGSGGPDERPRVVSAGVALGHAVSAARALGWAADTWRFPDAGRARLLARVEVREEGGRPDPGAAGPAPEPGAGRVPRDLVPALVAAAAGPGTRAVALPGGAATRIVLGGGRDAPLDWLRAGEGLSAVWLEAARTGLAAHVEALDDPGSRAALHDAVGWLPHVAVRLEPRPPSGGTVPDMLTTRH